jgi:hypothetical protein
MSYTLALALSLVALPQGAVANDSIRSDADIRSAVMRHAPAVRKCYEVEGLGRNPALAGSVEITVTILPTGSVTDVEVSTAKFRGVGEKEVAACLAGVARSWKFDRGPYIVETIILPFDLVRNVPTAKGAVPGKRAAE